jgi:hypothetical protein
MTRVPETIQELVRRFTRNREEYVSGKYNEAQLRREGIDLLRCWELSAVSRKPIAHLRQIAATDRRSAHG